MYYTLNDRLEDLTVVDLLKIYNSNKEFIFFASDEQDPVIYIVCESIKYEEIKDNY